MQVICSASLPEEVQKCKTTRRSRKGQYPVPTGSRREGLLQRICLKFKATFFNFQSEISVVRDIKNEKNRNLYVFQLSDVIQLYATTIHWYALVDFPPQPPTMQAIFFDYCRAVFSDLQAEDFKALYEKKRPRSCCRVLRLRQSQLLGREKSFRLRLEEMDMASIFQ